MQTANESVICAEALYTELACDLTTALSGVLLAAFPVLLEIRAADKLSAVQSVLQHGSYSDSVQAMYGSHKGKHSVLELSKDFKCRTSPCNTVH